MSQISFSRRVPTVAVLIIALVAGMFFAGGVSPAWAVSGISGTVKGDGDEVPGTTVTVYNASGDVVASQVTNSGGDFGVVLPDGDYRLRFQPPSGSGLAAEYWQHQRTLAAATVIAVGGSVVQQIFALEVGATISGRLETGGMGAGGTAQAWDSAGELVASTTFLSGDYTIIGLYPSTYRVKVTPSASVAYQWYGQTNSFDLATPVAVGSVATAVTGIDVDANTQGGFYGHVTSPDGLPMSGVRVIAWAESAASPRAATFAAQGTTDGSGVFGLFDIPVGDYRIGFTNAPAGVSSTYDLLPSTGGFVSQWLEKKYSWSTSQPLYFPGNVSYPVTTGPDGGPAIVLENPSFADVGDPSSTFYPFIEWMASEGISTGTPQPSGKPLFKPSDSVSRQAMALFLYRLSGDVFTPPAVETFADVPANSGQFTAIEWMASEGISTGTPQPSGKPLFNPLASVSRQSMAVFISRYKGASLLTPIEESFADVPITASTAAAIQWMKDTNISTGTAQPSGLPIFNPTSPVSRQAMSAFLYRTDHLPF